MGKITETTLLKLAIILVAVTTMVAVMVETGSHDIETKPCGCSIRELQMLDSIVASKSSTLEKTPTADAYDEYEHACSERQRCCPKLK